MPTPTSPTDFTVSVAGNTASLLVDECDETNNASDDSSVGCPVVD